MSRHALLGAAALACAVLAMSARAEPPAVAPVTIAGAVRFDLASHASGRVYRIFVYRADGPVPPGGWPLLVLTDGNGTFAPGAGAAALNALAGRGVLVVGVGYPTDDVPAQFQLRNRDLTSPTPLDAIERPPGAPPPKADEWGGSEQFYHFLTDELRPALAARYPVDATRQTLYGHSLGGLFTLGVLFRHPEAFQRYVASSPSIWWNDRVLLRGEAGFAARVRARAVAPRVWLSVGGEEQQVPALLPPGADRAAIGKRTASARMVDNARELAGRLAALDGAQGYRVQFEAFEHEDHISTMPASIGRAVRFASEP